MFLTTELSHYPATHIPNEKKSQTQTYIQVAGVERSIAYILIEGYEGKLETEKPDHKMILFQYNIKL